MIYARPDTDFDAWLTDAPTGLAGTITVRVEDADTGAVVVVDTTAGITEPRTGKYKKTFTAPSTRADYFVVWTNGPTIVEEGLEVTDEVPSPSADAFISVGDLGDYLGRDLSDDDGAPLVVAAASDFCRDIAEQAFSANTSTIYLDGSGTDALLLPELPVQAAGTVVVSDGFNPPTWTTAGSLDYILSDNGVLYANDTQGTSTFGTVWPRGRQNVRITYDHGYDSADFPESVRMVALSLASRLLVQGPSIAEGIGDVNVRYAGESTAVMPTERLILRKFKRAK